MAKHNYIKAFREGNNTVISSFYREHEQSFKSKIGHHFDIVNEDVLAEIFQDAISRTWENIQRGKLTEQNLISDFAGYVYKVGIHVAHEKLRIESSINSYEEFNSRDDEGGKSFQIEDVSAFEDIAEETESEKIQIVRDAVNNMGLPCAPLLLSFYWDKLSWEEIAKILGYKGADSAKAQKYKCMDKLKKHLEFTFQQELS